MGKFEIVWDGYEENDIVIDDMVQPYSPTIREMTKTGAINFEKNYRIKGDENNDSN